MLSIQLPLFDGAQFTAATMLSKTDLAVLNAFRGYLVTPGEMLCFHGIWLDEHQESLRHLTAKKLLTKEQFKGGYSLTKTGFAAIQNTSN